MGNHFAKAQRPVNWIRVRDLDVRWTAAQRPLNKRKVQAIAKEIDPDAIGVIAVAPMTKKGRYHIIDGQHRVAAVRQEWGDSERVPCQIIEGASSPEEAASIWLIINNERSKPNAFERFNVAITAGREVETAVNEIIRLSPYHLGKGGVTAVNACTRIYKDQGGPALEWVLSTAHQVWGTTGVTISAPIIDGFALFLKKFRNEDSDFETERLVNQIQKRYSSQSLLGSARAARETFGGSIASNVARVMVQAYNKRLRLEERHLAF